MGLLFAMMMMMTINDDDYDDDDDDVYQHEGSRARGRRFLSASWREGGQVKRALPVNFFPIFFFFLIFFGERGDK